MIIEKSNKSMISLIIMFVGWVLYITTSFNAFPLIIVAIGTLTYLSCDHIYYKKNKCFIELKLKGKKLKFENVKEVFVEGKSLTIEFYEGEKNIVHLENFSKKDLKRIV